MPFSFNPFTGTLDITGSGSGGSTSPGGSNRSVQFNNSGAFGGSTSVQIDAADHVDVIKTSIGTGTTTGLHLQNTTAATNGTQIQNSPTILWEGQAWKSFAPAASQTTIWRAYNRLQAYSATTTGGDLRFDASVNGGAYNTVLAIASGSPNGIGDASLTLAGRYIVNHNNSDSSPSIAATSPAWRINNTGTWSHLSFAFSGTFRGALSVSSSGDVRTYTSDKFTWIRDFTALTQLAELTNVGLRVDAGYGLFAGRVTAGFIDTTAPAVLNSRGSVAAQGTYVKAQSYYQIVIGDWAVYVDVDGATTCLGTPAACSTYGSQGACEAVDNCIWSPGASCSIFTDQETCEWESGCTWTTTACSTYTSETPCNSAGGDCSWSTANDCSVFGDETSCLAAPGGTCTWNGLACEGTYDFCSGTSAPTGPCTGTYGSGCSGTVAPCYLQTTCASVTGCTSSTGTAVILPPLNQARESNTSRFQWIKNVGASNNVTVIPYPGDSLEGSTVTLDPAASLGTHPILGQASCSVFGSEGACTPSGCSWVNGCSSYNNETDCNNAAGCSWDGGSETCSGNFTCQGNYTVLDRWNILSLYT